MSLDLNALSVESFHTADGERVAAPPDTYHSDCCFAVDATAWYTCEGPKN